MRKGIIIKAAVILIIIGFFIVFFAFDLDKYLTLSYLKESRENFRSFYSEYPVTVITCYMLIYILSTSLSLPGAAVLTLAGGALFGLFTGIIIVSFASTIGATLACFVSRYLLRDWVQDKFGDRLKLINEGIERDGAFYLFTLRLIPIFPFFMINLVMGLTKLPLITFYWVSQLGMLAGTAVYVNAGNQISGIESLSGILSPGLIISFVLIGIFPILAKKIIELIRAKKRLIK